MSVACYLLMPHLRRLIGSYGEEICNELSSQVRQDSWYGAEPYSLLIPIPHIGGGEDSRSRATNSRKANPGAYDIDKDTFRDMKDNVSRIGVGQSYNWLVALFEHILEDLGYLLLTNLPKGTLPVKIL